MMDVMRNMLVSIYNARSKNCIDFEIQECMAQILGLGHQNANKILATTLSF